jgi:hypothetical protein
MVFSHVVNQIVLPKGWWLAIESSDVPARLGLKAVAKAQL